MESELSGIFRVKLVNKNIVRGSPGTQFLYMRVNYFCKSLHLRCLTGLSIHSALNSKFSEFSDIFAKIWPTDLSNDHYDSTVRLHDILLDYLTDYFQLFSFWSIFCVNIMINLKLIFFILYLELVLFQYL